MIWMGILVLVGITASAVLGLVRLYPDANQSLTILVAVGFLTPTIVSLITVIKVRELHLAVNSRLTQLLEQTERAAQLAGRAAERRETQDASAGEECN